MIIANLIREFLLQEEVFGAQAFVYHGSSDAPETLIPAFANNEFFVGKKAGTQYGGGLYTVYDLEGSSTASGTYGNYIYKLKVNLYGFISFVPDATVKIYKKNLTVAEQAKLVGANTQTVQYLQRLVDREKDLKGEWTPPKPMSSLMGPPTSRERIAFNAAPHLNGVVKGMIYFRDRDGLCALIYDASVAVPVAWKKIGDSEWNKVDRELMKPALRRSSTGEWEKERYGTSVEKKVMQMFKLPPEQRVFPGGLDLSNSKITKLPDDLTVHGSFRINGSDIKELPKNLKIKPSKYGGLIDLSNTKITKLPDNWDIPSTMCYLDLSNSEIESLPKGLPTTGGVNIKNTKIKSIPPDFKGKIEK